MELGEIIQTIFDNGGMLGLSLVCLWMLNQVWKDRLSTEKANGNHWEIEAKANREVIQANTQAITQLCERLERDK